MKFTSTVVLLSERYVPPKYPGLCQMFEKHVQNTQCSHHSSPAHLHDTVLIAIKCQNDDYRISHIKNKNSSRLDFLIDVSKCVVHY